MARISRLIGISDTTVKRHGWQVHFAGTSVRNPGKNRLAERPNARNATPMEWRFAVLRWSLASQAIEDGGYFHRAFYRFFRPVSPFEGPLLWRMLLPGPAVHWAGLDLLQQPVHHWHFSCSNSSAVPIAYLFQLLTGFTSVYLSIFWKV